MSKNMEIPSDLLAELAYLNLKSYEWRVLMAIITEVYNEEEGMLSIDMNLNKLVDQTGIQKPHICRTLGSLEKKRFIKRMRVMGDPIICFYPNRNQWEV